MLEAKLSWTIFSSLNCHLLSTSVCDSPSLWLWGKYLWDVQIHPEHQTASEACNRHVSILSFLVSLCFHQCIWKVPGVWFSLFCSYKNLMNPWPDWNIFGVVWIRDSGPWLLICGSQINQSLLPFKVRAVFMCTCLMMKLSPVLQTVFHSANCFLCCAEVFKSHGTPLASS